MTKSEKALVVVTLVALPNLCLAAGNQLTVKAVNTLSFARPSQTIELSAKDLAPLGDDLTKIHVRDVAGNEVLCQAVDTDYDAYHTPDIVIFQANFAPKETKSFTAYAGAKQEYTREQFKAHGRFVRERFDDFAWENDRIAHRTYGKALETWAGEPLISSSIDVWSKRTPRMVIDEWYMVDNYHADEGDGFDDYTAGQTRGCGGTGIWAADKLWVANNFVDSRVLANGPIRVVFELVYDPFDVNGVGASEVKRVTLDAGQNLNHYQSFYKAYSRPEKPVTLTMAVGLKKVDGEEKALNSEHAWLAKWEPMEKNAGMQGLAVIVDPKLFERQTEDKRNLLMLAKVPADGPVSFWAGFCWDKAGPFTSLDAWKTYVDEFAQGLASPIEVSVAAP
ncbi:MAG TPA: DUF4861 family protein [Verrucomicrobiae bacterium]|nr:DUF4861 family protein [Verrucomicrobiae bacterium]